MPTYFPKGYVDGFTFVDDNSWDASNDRINERNDERNTRLNIVILSEVMNKQALLKELQTQK